MTAKIIDKQLAAEMLRLREEEKLSNKAIAKRMDVSYATVLRAIGKQDFVSSKGSYYEESTPAKKKEPERTLKTVRKVTTLQGQCLIFTVDTEGASVLINSRNESMPFEALIPFELIEVISAEIAQVANCL